MEVASDAKPTSLQKTLPMPTSSDHGIAFANAWFIHYRVRGVVCARGVPLKARPNIVIVMPGRCRTTERIL